MKVAVALLFIGVAIIATLPESDAEPGIGLISGLWNIFWRKKRSPQFDPAEIKFAHLDKNGDGVISPLEAATVLRKRRTVPTQEAVVEANKDWAAIDSNGDGVIELDEFEEGFKKAHGTK